MPTVVTHSGYFHADDLYAVATLRLLLGDIKIVRTRDEEKIAEADYVVDVGKIYDSKTKRFDHHQKDGAGKRENGIPYAAFGLVWKEYGENLAGAQAQKSIDESFVQQIDATDNGVDIYTPVFEDVFPVTLNSLVTAFRPTWKEEVSDELYDEKFLMLLPLAEAHLKRLIKITQDAFLGREFVEKAYEEAEDKRLITLEKGYPWQKVLLSYPEPLYVVSPRYDGSWSLKTVNKNGNSFENRKDLPKEWAGKSSGELARITGVPDAIFTHNKLFLAVAGSKEGALALAQQALSD